MDSLTPAADPVKPKLKLGRSGAKDITATQSPWPILVVDDDTDVHAMTRVLLRDFSYQDRGFEVISAHSAAEARQILAERRDIPVVLLDVVMETPDAGLSLVHHIRAELNNQHLAIVLRTGQPGEAPEREVMLTYDINDYRAKTDLTAQKLFTSLIGGLRSWISLTTIDHLNANLERRVAERTHQLDEARRFAEHLIDMLPNPVWYKTQDGRLALRNRAFDELFGGDGEAVPFALTLLDAEIDHRLAAEGLDGVTLEANMDIRGAAHSLLVNKGALKVGENCAGGSIGVITDITERKRMEHQLLQLAITDDLTQTLNRRAFFAAAEQELERTARYGGPLSVVMMDLDHFKTVNDTYGHAVGDQALRVAATAIRATLREVDMFGRLGGEEFAALLPETSLAGAAEVAERLRLAIASAAIPLGPNQPPLYLTTSLGVAERQPNELSVDQVLARADSALYLSKARGRNRVTV